MKFQSPKSHTFYWRVFRDPPFVDATGQSEEEWTEIRSYDIEEAAEQAAEAYDQDGDYLLSRGQDVAIEVKSPDESIRKFRCRAELSPTYYVSEIKQ